MIEAETGSVFVGSLGCDREIAGEQWVDLPPPWNDYPYQVSNCGRVRSLHEHHQEPKVLDPYRGGPEGEYPRVELVKEDGSGPRVQPYVHQLVAAAFLDCEPDQVPDHINGDPTDNRVDNLRCQEFTRNLIRHV